MSGGSEMAEMPATSLQEATAMMTEVLASCFHSVKCAQASLFVRVHINQMSWTEIPAAAEWVNEEYKKNASMCRTASYHNNQYSSLPESLSE